MKKVFTLALVMAMAITSFAQVKGISRKDVKPEPVQQMSFKGFETFDIPYYEPTRSIMGSAETAQLSQCFYDWQSNMGARNYVAVWPDGYAVMCYTQSTDEGSSDRGTGLAIWDPAVGEWEYTGERVEGVRTGFGSIARYKENGLIVAAHTASDCRIFICENFRDDPTQSFGEGIVMPAPTGADPCWPVVQCSGNDLDIIHVLCTNNGAEDPYTNPIVYYRYENGEWTHQCEILPTMGADVLSDGGSNIAYFMLYDPEKPNRVSFILNNSWSDCKLVISEDNGETWGDRVFWQHPGINADFTDEWFMYPRWTNAAFDGDDNLHVVYEFNGSTGVAGSGSYYPGIGGIGYWSEILPKNELCKGGIGEVGQPFIMDSTYVIEDIYSSAWYWDDQEHDMLPEHIGTLEVVDGDFNVLPRDSEEGEFPVQDQWKEHGSYNGGTLEFATMHYDKATNRIFAFWSSIAGNESTVGWNSDLAKHYLKLFGNVSLDGGNTWLGTKVIENEFDFFYHEMVYDQVIPYVYHDAEGDYLWVMAQMDEEPGTCVQNDESAWDNNFYYAVKVYVNMWEDVEENPMTVAQTVNVYPNPAQGSFNVTLNNESDVVIYNTVGQVVKTYNSVKEINVNLEAGVYFVNAGNQTVKVVVK